MNTVLVTGGAGYIGSHTCKALAAAGYLPVVFDNLFRGFERAVRWGPFEQGDIIDRGRLDAVLEKHKPVAVVHFAALAYVGESVSDPAAYYRNNAAGTLALLEAMGNAGVGRIIFSSSCATYGVPQRLPIVEDTPQAPVNPYGWSKLFAEHMIADFGAAHAMQWAALRYFNAAGADPDGEIGEDHDPETHLIPLALDAASGRRGGLTVFGADYPTPDGSCVRDYVHVSDLAQAHVKALRSLEQGGPSQAYNLGSGQGYSVFEVIEAAGRISGLSVPHTKGPRRAGDPAILVADAARANAVLGWKPAIPQLDAMVRTAWEWRRPRDA